MAENLLNLLKNMDVHMQEAQQTPSSVNAQYLHKEILYMLKILKPKDKILKAAKEK